MLFKKSAGNEQDPLASAKAFIRSNGLVEELKRSACYDAAMTGGLVGKEHMMVEWNSELDAKTLAKLGVGEHFTLEQALEKDVEKRNKAVEARTKDLSRLDTTLNNWSKNGTDPMLVLNLFAGVVRTSEQWEPLKTSALIGMAAFRHLFTFDHAEIMVSESLEIIICGN